MAGKIALVGDNNSGKSKAGDFILKGEEWFVIAPNDKKIYIKQSNKEKLPYCNLSTDKSKSTEEIANALKLPVYDIGNIILQMEKKKAPYLISGNHIITSEIESIGYIMRNISDNRPDIKYILLSDFTHFVSGELSKDSFVNRKIGGEAFAKYLELAADTLNNTVKNIDLLRRDLIVVIEYHVNYNEEDKTYEIFVPGGKMLIEKFKLDSYYDYIFYTKYIDDEKVKFENRFQFVTRKDGKYNARSAGIFGNQVTIPNNLQVVIDKVREDRGI